RTTDTSVNRAPKAKQTRKMVSIAGSLGLVGVLLVCWGVNRMYGLHRHLVARPVPRCALRVWCWALGQPVPLGALRSVSAFRLGRSVSAFRSGRSVSPFRVGRSARLARSALGASLGQRGSALGAPLGQRGFHFGRSARSAPVPLGALRSVRAFRF